MTNIVSFHEDRVLFGTGIPKDVNACLQQAVAAGDDIERAEQFLWQAQRLNPDQLEVYIALYKFYFYKNRITEAEEAVNMALQRAARMGGFSEDWRQLSGDSSDWMNAYGPQRVYLYSLKALAFIRLRQCDSEMGESILNKLQELDPKDQVGGSVLLALCAAIRE